MKKKLLVILGFIFVLALGIGQAQAATYYLYLYGNVADCSFYDFNDGGTNYSGWSLGLTGLRSFAVNKGETIDATIILSAPVTIPASAYNTWLDLCLYGDTSPGYDTGTTATTTFYNGGVTGSTFENEIYSANWVVAGAVIFPPDNSAEFTFDKVTINFSIDKIGDVGDDNLLDLTHATLNAQMQNPAVPIPGAIWLLGSGVLGLLGFKRKFNK